MSRFPLRFYFVLLVIAVLAAVPAITSDPVVLHIFIYIFFFAYFGLAWSIVGMLAGQPSMGHGVFFGLGAYTSSILLVNYGTTPWLGMIAGGGVAAIVGVALGLPSFRLRGPFFALLTLSFSLVCRLLFIYFEELTGGPTGLRVPLVGDAPLLLQFSGKAPYYYVILALTFILLFVRHRIERSKFGYYLSAIRENEDAAKSLGVNVLRQKLKAAAISAFFTAPLGTFYMQYTRYINPDDAFGLWRTFEPMIIGVLGGPALYGPLVASFILTPISEITIILFGAAYMTLRWILYGAILLLIILFLPGGLGGVFKKLYDVVAARQRPVETAAAMRGD